MCYNYLKLKENLLRIHRADWIMILLHYSLDGYILIQTFSCQSKIQDGHHDSFEHRTLWENGIKTVSLKQQTWSKQNFTLRVIGESCARLIFFVWIRNLRLPPLPGLLFFLTLTKDPIGKWKHFFFFKYKHYWTQTVHEWSLDGP